jgi:hypothetical protein
VVRKLEEGHPAEEEGGGMSGKDLDLGKWLDSERLTRAASVLWLVLALGVVVLGLFAGAAASTLA